MDAIIFLELISGLDQVLSEDRAVSRLVSFSPFLLVPLILLLCSFCLWRVVLHRSFGGFVLSSSMA